MKLKVMKDSLVKILSRFRMYPTMSSGYYNDDDLGIVSSLFHDADDEVIQIQIAEQIESVSVNMDHNEDGTNVVNEHIYLFLAHLFLYVYAHACMCWHPPGCNSGDPRCIYVTVCIVRITSFWLLITLGVVGRIL